MMYKLRHVHATAAIAETAGSVWFESLEIYAVSGALPRVGDEIEIGETRYDVLYVTHHLTAARKQRAEEACIATVSVK